jgi:hypothetical protein
MNKTISWQVKRIDDNGHVEILANGLSQLEAVTLVYVMEARGHKQTYIAHPVDTSND